MTNNIEHFASIHTSHIEPPTEYLSVAGRQIILSITDFLADPAKFPDQSINMEAHDLSEYIRSGEVRIGTMSEI